VEVADDEIRIMGSKSELLRALASDKILLTDKAISKLPLSKGAAYYVRDIELVGLW